MTTRDRIKAEVDRVGEERLDELYSVIKSFSHPKKERSGLLARLKEIKIEAPEDFSMNHDAYASGEKLAGPDLR